MKTTTMSSKRTLLMGLCPLIMSGSLFAQNIINNPGFGNNISEWTYSFSAGGTSNSGEGGGNSPLLDEPYMGANPQGTLRFQASTHTLAAFRSQTDIASSMVEGATYEWAIDLMTYHIDGFPVGDQFSAGGLLSLDLVGSSGIGSTPLQNIAVFRSGNAVSVPGSITVPLIEAYSNYSGSFVYNPSTSASSVFYRVSYSTSGGFFGNLDAAPDMFVDRAYLAQAAAIPEPGVVSLAAAGLLVMFGHRRRNSASRTSRG